MSLPGPGDEVTWPAYAGHPNDPRAPAEHDCGCERCAEEFEGECIECPECRRDMERAREDFEAERRSR